MNKKEFKLLLSNVKLKSRVPGVRAFVANVLRALEDDMKVNQAGVIERMYLMEDADGRARLELVREIFLED